MEGCIHTYHSSGAGLCVMVGCRWSDCETISAIEYTELDKEVWVCMP
jgi:hypothetical protein